MNGVFGAALGIADWLCKGMILYCGALWMLGQQTQASKHALSGAVGYYIIRHYLQIWTFMRGL